MKTYRTIYALLAAASMTLTACNDSDDWTPGPVTDPTSPAVYFSADNPDEVEFEDYEAKTVTVTVLRNNAAQAADVPLTLEASDPAIKAPASVHFDAGQKKAEVTLDCEGIPAGRTFDIRVSVPAEYADQYGAGSTFYEARVMIIAWDELCPVKYNYYVSGAWMSQTTEGKLLMQAGTDKLRITDFAGSGLDLMFRLDATTVGATSSAPDIVPYFNADYAEDAGYGIWYLFDQAAGIYPEWSIDGSSTIVDFMCYREGYSYLDWEDKAAGKGSFVFTGYLDFADGSSSWSYIYTDFVLPEGVSLPLKGNL